MIWDPDCKGPCDCPGEEMPTSENLLAEVMTEVAIAELPDEDVPGAIISGLAERGYTLRKLPAPAQAFACDDHKPVQHRDRKPKWCNKCGRDARGQLIGTAGSARACCHPIDSVDGDGVCTDCGEQL